MPGWLKKAHHFVAAAFFHATLLLLLILLALRFWVPVEEGDPIYSQHFVLASYSRTSPADAHETGAEFDRMGEQSSYTFKPWTLFGESAYQSRLLNVEANGVRRTIGVPTEVDCDGREKLRVWVFGGSTVFGWGLPDDQTIPTHLQARLAADFPERCVQVTNHGHSYYFSSVELAYFTHLLRTESRPDCAVFLDGLNDALYLPAGMDVPYFAEVAFNAWERERESVLGVVSDKPWVTVNRSLPVFRLLERLESPGKKQFELAGRYSVAPADPIGYAVETFRTNHRVIQSLCEEFGIEVLHCLQPTRLHEVEGLGNGEAILGFLAKLRAGDVEGLVSIEDCLQGIERPYVDGAHYSDEACYVIANELARRIGERFGRTL